MTGIPGLMKALAALLAVLMAMAAGYQGPSGDPEALETPTPVAVAPAGTPQVTNAPTMAPPSAAVELPQTLPATSAPPITAAPLPTAPLPPASMAPAPPAPVAPAPVAPATVAPAPATGAAPVIDVNTVLPHLEKLQSIADGNDGNRATGTPGYTQSVEYVAQTLTAAGFTVERQPCSTCTNPGDENVIADWPGGDTASTIMFGAHLDSVPEGAGADDNASGTAALLQVALNLATSNPTLTKHVRFAWWADEEPGMGGSSYYVETAGVADLEAYINLDMVASPNPGYFLTNLDSTYGQAMAAYLSSAGAAPEEMAADCDCSDDEPFYSAGVPTTYLSTSSNDDDAMSAEQAQKWQGTAGESFDVCYHSSCDTYPENISTAALERSTNTTAQALWTLAVSRG